jgi:tetratricopeptide (TPR) repeat protein
LLADSITAPSLLTLRVLSGDALWRLDSVAGAMRVYSELLRSHLSLAWDESLTLRLEILAKPTLARSLNRYFVSQIDDSTRIALLERLIAEQPGEVLPKFLLARERIARKEYDGAATLLEMMPPLKSPILELSRRRRLGQLYFAVGRYERAKIHFWQSLNHVYRDAQALETEEKLRFCEWMTSAAPAND